LRVGKYSYAFSSKSDYQCVLRVTREAMKNVENFTGFGKRYTVSARRENMLQMKLFRQEPHFVIIWNDSHFKQIELEGERTEDYLWAREFICLPITVMDFEMQSKW